MHTDPKNDNPRLIHLQTGGWREKRSAPPRRVERLAASRKSADFWVRDW